MLKKVSEFDIVSMIEDGKNIRGYLEENGYVDSEKSFNEFMSSVQDGDEYLYSITAGKDITGDLPPSMLNSSQLAMILEYNQNNGNDTVAAMYLECVNGTDALEVYNNAEDWFGGRTTSVYNKQIIENHVFFVMETHYVPSEPEGPTVTPLGNLSLEEASKFDSIGGYLEDNGYTRYTGTVDEYFSKSPDAYSFIQMKGNEFPGETGMPAGLKEAPVVVVIAGAFNEYEQSTGFYAECKDEEAANDLMVELNAMTLPEGGQIMLNGTSGNKVLWAMYAKVSQPEPEPDVPTNPRRSIELRSIIETSGEHIVEIAPYNYSKDGIQQEGPKAINLVKVQGFGFIVDNEGVNIVHQRNSAIVNEALECGMNLHLSTKDENKMLPENVDVSGGFSNGYYYNRQSDNYRFGWLNIHGPVNGDIYVNFGELPDYSTDKQIAFVLQTAPASEFKQEFTANVDNWETFASYEDNQFIFDPKVKELQYNLDGVVYPVGTYNGEYYDEVYSTTISKNKTYYIVTDESLFSEPIGKTFYVINDGEQITYQANNWSDIAITGVDGVYQIIGEQKKFIVTLEGENEIRKVYKDDGIREGYTYYLMTQEEIGNQAYIIGLNNMDISYEAQNTWNDIINGSTRLTITGEETILLDGANIIMNNEDFTWTTPVHPNDLIRPEFYWAR